MPRGTRTAVWGSATVLALLVAAPLSAADETTNSIVTIKAVSREGTGNDAAGQAWKTLVAQGVPALIPTLEAIDESNPRAANWLRTAVDAIAETEAKAGRKLPADKLEAFTKDTKFAPSARRIAYELLVKQDTAAKARLLPGFLNDPSPELRRDAVAAALDGATTREDLEKLFTFTRDPDQVDAVAKLLDEKHKTRVSVSEHYAFVTHWHLVGPFDSSEGKALTLAHSPEKATDAAGKFKVKSGADVAWKPHVTGNRYGYVDLNKAVGKEKDAAAYALAVVRAEKDTPCEIRVGTPNAIQVFLNGTKVFEREEYHHGDTMDLNNGKGTLKAGKNVIVIKVCQNNQTETWAQEWKFQLRVCDATGGAIPGVTQIVTDGGQEMSIKLGFIPDSAKTKEEKK